MDLEEIKRLENLKRIGGPAFPQPCTENGYPANTPYSMAGGGMSLRDYFAGQALTGMLASTNKFDDYAKKAYVYADAMIKFSNLEI